MREEVYCRSQEPLDRGIIMNNNNNSYTAHVTMRSIACNANNCLQNTFKGFSFFI